MLELDSLHRRFAAPRPEAPAAVVRALDGLSFTVARGELCGFLGPNGAGKTTAMRAVVGVTRLDAGQVRWDGVPIGSDVRGRTGYLPEERGLYPKMRVAEHLIYLARLHGISREGAVRRTEALLEELGLAERAGHHVQALSLGNQQRVQLAAALVHDPELLVLDEPFSGLDPLAVDTMSAMLQARADAGAAVMFSSHQLDLVEDLCRTVAIIAEGRTVLAGEVASLRAAGIRRVHLAVEGGADWAHAPTPGARLVHAAGDEATFALTPDADPGALIALAQRAGRITKVSLEEPRLSQLFRDAVGGANGGVSGDGAGRPTVPPPGAVR
ncbi:ABC transporter ATP-binding protein [Nitriliruptor alkaliphilus]|uniref:ABC transporter ATP-binding protein n=1 Tax=Nitriliruptor alkaliphilus TaxID=427918 RepID=UPI0009F94A5B|nr:ATP-binding cassette domain-containing protein [Nitriliruptor alkaliphilus]